MNPDSEIPTLHHREQLNSPWLIAVLWLFVTEVARPDIIVFRTGEQLQGRVVSEQAASVTFDSAALGRIEISRDRIQRVEPDPVAAGVAPPASPTASATSVTSRATQSREFLRFYTDHGIRYEFVQPLHVVDPWSKEPKVLSETISVRGRLGFRGSFDAAAYQSGAGQQEVDAGVEVRSLRVYTEGEFGLLRTNQFKLDLGLANGEFYLHDAFLRWLKLPYVGNLTLGYFTVPQTLENITSFGANTFMEAASPGLAFSPGHRVGIEFGNTYLNERITASLGLFSVGQNANIDFGDSSDALARPTLRLTGLVIDQPDQHRRLHLGGSASFVFSDSSEIRYQARPESHLAPALVDTGQLDARFAYIGGFEVIYQDGPFTLQSEIMGSTVDADANYLFWGGYVSAGWLLTGERQGFDRGAGVTRQVKPATPLDFKRHGWGALELAIRYSYLNLQDGNVDGGRMNILMPGLNWYWTEHIRWQFNYGFAHVTEGPSPGNLNILQARLQLGF